MILLDVMLPQKNGFEILTSLRKAKIKTPIIMLTAKSEMINKLNGLENGADDYITKPFSTRELVARTKIILKRTNNIEDTSVLEYGDLTLDMTMASDSYYEGAINIDNSAKEITLKLDSSSKIKLTGDSYVTTLEDEDTSYSNIDFNGYKLYVNGTSIN